MKDLDKDYIYDLSDLNKEERTELFDYLMTIDKSYSSSGIQFKKIAKDLIYFDNYNQWFWCDWDYAPDYFNKQIKKERLVINAKTLFEPKVNIINPTESDNIQECIEYFKAQTEAIKNALGVKVNDLIDSLNYMKEKFNSKQCTSGEQDLKCNIDFVESENFINSDFIQKPKYKFQHVEVNKINDSIDLIFFKEKKNGTIKVKRVPYLQNINEEVKDCYLNEIKDNVIKFLEECEK